MAVRLETSGGSSQQGSEASLEESLERGACLLATLVQAARAARLEAELAELQAALAEARAGSGRRLERWLHKFDAAGGVDGLASAPLGQPSPGEVYRRVDLPEPVAMRGWAPYLVHARRRLQTLQQARPGVLDDLLIDFDQRLDAIDQPARRSVRLPSAAPELADERSGPAENTAIEESVSDCAAEATATDEPDEDAVTELSAGDEACVIDLSIAGAGDRRAAAEEEVPRSRSLTRSMLSGFSLSLFGHVALLAILFAITLKLPGESASLGSQIVSVAAPADEVELSAEFGAIEPVEMELPETVDSSLDEPSLASLQQATLSEIEPLAVEADSLGGAASAASGPSASTGAMLSAAATSHGDRGQGGRGGQRGARGGPAMSSSGGKFFGAGAGGNFFCYVVDSSGSMRGAAWESAKAELARSIGTLSEKQRFYIVFFAKEIAAIPEPGGREPAAHGLEASKENIEHARRWIETVKLDRGGPPNEALELAISREPDAIYLLTDGVTQVDVCAFLREKNRTSDIVSGEQVRVPIHTIAYRSLDGQQLLRQLAQENAGQFHYVPAPK